MTDRNSASRKYPRLSLDVFVVDGALERQIFAAAVVDRLVLVAAARVTLV